MQTQEGLTMGKETVIEVFSANVVETRFENIDRDTIELAKEYTVARAPHREWIEKLTPHDEIVAKFWHQVDFSKTVNSENAQKVLDLVEEMEGLPSFFRSNLKNQENVVWFHPRYACSSQIDAEDGAKGGVFQRSHISSCHQRKSVS
jgi:hypothetical protein